MVRIPKTVRNTLVSVVVMVLLFVAAATIYVLITGRTTQPVPAPKASSAADQLNPVKPTAPAANAQEGVAVENFITPVAAGDNTTLEVLTNAGSTCSIKAVYNNIASRDSGLVTKTADAYGFASWTWTVDRTTPAGSWPVTVTCAYHGRTGVYIGQLQVTK